MRGPDGTLIYLISRDEPDVWSQDFVLTSEAGSDARLDVIDHLALALPAGRMDTYVLFWRSLFGLAPQPLFDLPDPFGLIQSRAMVNASGTLRLTFNVSDARDTVTNRFVSAFAGAGVHHIALATPNAYHAMTALQDAGAPMLLIPHNYYDDVATRLSLDPGVIKGLEPLGLLYDEDTQGSFRHGYTEPFQNRFFFEVVERVGGYAGFGAPNAAVRMAAQARRRPAPI